MRTAKDIAFTAMMTAILVAAQLALGMVQGVEVVTVLFLSFCVTLGVRRGMLVANTFSLARCLLFGFFPTAVVLYVVYYNLFAVVFGSVGKAIRKLSDVKRLIILVAAAVVMTAVFTLLDDIITPLMLGYSVRIAKVYFLSSLPVMGIQSACAAVSVSLLFLPLTRAFERIDVK